MHDTGDLVHITWFLWTLTTVSHVFLYSWDILQLSINSYVHSQHTLSEMTWSRPADIVSFDSGQCLCLTILWPDSSTCSCSPCCVWWLMIKRRWTFYAFRQLFTCWVHGYFIGVVIDLAEYCYLFKIVDGKTLWQTKPSCKIRRIHALHLTYHTEGWGTYPPPLYH